MNTCHDDYGAVPSEHDIMECECPCTECCNVPEITARELALVRVIRAMRMEGECGCWQDDEELRQALAALPEDLRKAIEAR